MKTIIFIRHGESVANVSNMLTSELGKYPLTDLGVAQVTSIAKTIGRTKIDGLYTSPILRAAQTAQIISNECGIEPILDKRLIERQMGSLNNSAFGSRDEMVNAMLEEIKSGYTKGMEPWKDMQNRLRSFIDSTKEGTVIAVTHHDPILAALGLVDNQYDDFDESTRIAMASATTIDFENMRILCISSDTIPALTAH